ncbi:hypothetical protein [Microbacterium immunditiarum]|uniref:DUF4913 domain-containing protein n=1 Tax=Microbacterium immunditiarum TaxID=337480 RepID=A0A7Y9GKA0_9MICO|nr:hypothetical protein [Microbacterium immunditiarum]NYE18018.1 hypothetical protein [Microbacterium immunditiarum]
MNDDKPDIETLMAREQVGFLPASQFDPAVRSGSNRRGDARNQFDPRSRAGSSEPIGAHAVDWRRLGDENAAAEWRMLRDWVEWFTVRYNIAVSVVPDCWWRHGALVEELSALHIAHLASFDSSDGGYGAIGWHEHLSLALPRLTRAGAGCASGHTDSKPRSWSNRTDEQEWEAWIAETHAHGERKKDDDQDPGHHRGQPHG